MENKLDKLMELGELLKSGTITQEEFNNLKNELLNPEKQSGENLNLKDLDKSKATSLKKETINLNQKVKLKSNTNINTSRKDENFSSDKSANSTVISGNEKSGYSIGYYFLIAVIIFFIYVGKSFISQMNEDKKQNSENVGNSSSSDSEPRKCSRCYGSGKVATYSSLTCEASHFDYRDCGEGHKSEYDCFAVGSKTCPCCKGTGKPYYQ